MKDRSFERGLGAFVAAAAMAVFVVPTQSALADTAFQLELQETGKRDYYCTATFALTAEDFAPLKEINGFFHTFVDDEKVGRTRGASFLFDEGKKSASAMFKAPNLPCADINGYAFVVGACLRDRRFIDLAECAAEIKPVAPIRQVTVP